MTDDTRSAIGSATRSCVSSAAERLVAILEQLADHDDTIADRRRLAAGSRHVSVVTDSRSCCGRARPAVRSVYALGRRCSELDRAVGADHLRDAVLACEERRIDVADRHD